MKKLLSLILAGTMLFSLAACTDSSNDKDDDNDKKNNSDIVEDNGDVGFDNGGEDAVADNGVEIGEYITFGSYEQDNDTSNGKEPIEWLVLDKQDGKVLVISKYALDSQKYNEIEELVTWESCTLREWLNDEFINVAFTDSEKSNISVSKVTADLNPQYSTDSGNDTQDEVFLLSEVEANKYYSSWSSRECQPSEYAKAQGCNVDEADGKEGNCWWWLRTPGVRGDFAAFVNSGGHDNFTGEVVNTNGFAVRPAMWIEL